MSSEPLRLFIAIELPAAARDVLAALQKRLQSADANRAIRWSSLDGIHLTLKFLGDVAPDKIASITAGLTAATAGRKPFDLTVAGAGCFPNLRKPRVVWAGSGGNSAALHALRDVIEQHVAPLGYPTDERPFSPHFTLGRARQEASASALAAIGEQIGKMDVGTLYSWRVDGLSLMRSDLKPSGAVYTQVAQFEL
jgi:2'-5' RNA ligase